MLTLALALSVSLIHPSRLNAWAQQIDAAGWTWLQTSPDRQVEVFARPVKGPAGPQVWLRTERFAGDWQSQMAKLAFDCRAGQVSVMEVEDFGGMNLSGEVRDHAAADWRAPDTLLKPILRSACGS